MLRLTFILGVAALLLASSQGHTVSEDDSIADPHVHVQLSIRTLSLLKELPDAEITLTDNPEARVNISTVAAYLDGEQDAMAQGQVLADFGGGSAEIFGNSVGRAVFSHFYNPETREGYRGGSTLPEFVGAFQRLGLLSDSLTQLLGPASLPATDMAQWAYATALHALVGGGSSGQPGDPGFGRANLTQAVLWASHATHLVQDSGVPQHTTDRGAEDSRSRHVEYEAWVEANMDAMPFPPLAEAAEGGPLTPGALAALASLRPEDLVKRIAALSAAQIDAAMSTDEDRLRTATAPLLREAVVFSAALYLRLFAQARAVRHSLGLDMVGLSAEGELPGASAAERAAATQAVASTEDDVVVLQIVKVAASRVEISGADMRPLVQVLPPGAALDQGFPQAALRGLRGGYLADSNVVFPQRLMNAFGWTFAHRVTREEREAGRVRFRFAIDEVHANLWCGGDCGEATSRLAISEEGETADVVFALDSNQTLVSNVTTGCALPGEPLALPGNHHKDCDSKTATVTYAVGRAFAITAVEDTFTTGDLWFGTTPTAFMLFVLALVGMCCCCCCCCGSVVAVRRNKKTASV